MELGGSWIRGGPPAEMAPGLPCNLLSSGTGNLFCVPQDRQDHETWRGLVGAPWKSCGAWQYSYMAQGRARHGAGRGRGGGGQGGGACARHSVYLAQVAALVIIGPLRRLSAEFFLAMQQKPVSTHGRQAMLLIADCWLL